MIEFGISLIVIALIGIILILFNILACIERAVSEQYSINTASHQWITDDRNKPL
jgi:hypothetical protein